MLEGVLTQNNKNKKYFILFYQKLKTKKKILEI